MIRRILPLGVAVGLHAILTIAACSSDDDTSRSTSGPDASTPETASGDDGAAQPSALPSYVVPGSEAMAAITLNEATGEFFVDSAESGKIYRGTAGTDAEITLELFADLTAAGVAHGGHIALSPDGKTIFMLSALGEQPRVSVVDVASRTLVKTVAMASSGGPFPASVQDVVISPDGATLYATSSFDNVIHTVNLATDQASTFPISSEFPHIADASQGFLNATGLAVSRDGKYLLVVHIIDKHLYRISLDPGSLGKAQKVATDPYNVSGNGLWLGAGDEVIEVAGDELRILRFKLDAELTKGDFVARYQSDAFEQGLTYAVSHGDRVLVLNGSGLALGGGPGLGGGIPDGGGPPPGDAGEAGDAGGFPPPGGGDAGAKKLPIKVLQLRR